MRSRLSPSRVLGAVRSAVLLVVGADTDRRRRRSARPGQRAAGNRGGGEGATGATGTARPAAVDIGLSGVRFEYTPSADGDPDPGEVVWTWVPYEDDPSQGKDRPVVVVGHRGPSLVGVALTSKRTDRSPQVEVGAGPWDRQGRTSYAKLDRVLELDPAQVRREGATLRRDRFDAVVAALTRARDADR